MQDIVQNLRLTPTRTIKEKTRKTTIRSMIRKLKSELKLMKLRNQQKILVEEALVLVVQETDQLEQKMLHIGDREEIDVLDQVGDELERQEQREQVD